MRNIQLGITDHYAPDVQAMLQAMYSRSSSSIADRLPDNSESEQVHREKFGKFYTQYLHKSVGQLGGTTIWLEGISQLAAKAVENTPLFNGQESSTRYINFAEQPMVSTDSSITNWQERFRALYIKALPVTIEMIKDQYPFEANQQNYHHKEDDVIQEARMRTTWENTIKARAFDICRGILPAGVTTSVAFTGTFDLINDHFGEMLYHPCVEMREIASEVLFNLALKYPYAAISKDKLYDRFSHVDNDFFYQDNDILAYKSKVHINNRKLQVTPKTVSMLSTRDKFDTINKVSSDAFRMSLYGCLDFGSYRDLHRHRNGVINMEILGVFNQFSKWYIDNLPVSIATELSELLKEYEVWHTNITYLTEYEKQYSVPMGYRMNVSYSCGLNQALYILELRSGKTVHQSLRNLVNEWVQGLKSDYVAIVDNTLSIHNDDAIDNFTLRRGEQTFNAELLEVTKK